MSQENEPTHRDFILNIHDHISPLRDRVAKVEAITEYHDKEFREMKASLSSIQNRVGSNHREVMEKMDNNHKEILAMFREHDKADHKTTEEVMEKIHSNDKSTNGLKLWIIGIGVGLTLLVGIVELADKIGLFNLTP